MKRPNFFFWAEGGNENKSREDSLMLGSVEDSLCHTKESMNSSL
jgi:hypothetical protein